MSAPLRAWMRFLGTRKGPTYGTLVRQLWHSLRADGARTTWRRVSDLVQTVSDSAETPVPPADTRKLCLFVSGCGGAPRRYRCEHQAEQLALAGYTSDIVDYPAAPLQKLLHCYRCFVLQRVPYDPHVHSFMRAALEQGRQVLFDIDDLVFDTRHVEHLAGFERNNPHARAYRESYLERIRRSLALAPHIMVSSVALKEELERQFPHKEVHLSPNVASRELVALSTRARRGVGEKHRPLTLGYFSGSPTHQEDLQSILPALVKVLAAEPEVELLLAGSIERPVGLAPFGDRVRTQPPVPWPELPHLLRRADIHLAPLAEGPFNVAKSEIKYIEAALVERPTVATDVGVFRTCIVDGENGFLCATTGDWVAAISRLLRDGPLRKRIGRAARAEVEGTRTTAQGRVVEALRSALAPREQLPCVVALGEAAEDVQAALAEGFLSGGDPDVALWTDRVPVPEAVSRRARRVLVIGEGGPSIDAWPRVDIGQVAHEVAKSLR